MKRLFALILACILALALVSCARTAEEGPTWQEQYDLGLRYLSEGNYEEAILAFTAAIEIDPKRVEAYIGLADSYTGLGDTEQARQVIEEALELLGELPELTDRLALLMGNDDGSVSGDPEEDSGEIPVEVSGTLLLSDLVCAYEPNKYIQSVDKTFDYVALNGMLNGPNGIIDVRMCLRTKEVINNEMFGSIIAETLEMWKDIEAFPLESTINQIPTLWECSFPVQEREHGEIVNMLLIGAKKMWMQ